jgi:DNA-directed RNA polymerase specialized sigma subunit
VTPATSHSFEYRTGESLLAAKRNAALLRDALLSLSDRELTVVLVRSGGATARETVAHAGVCHVQVLRTQKKAMKKLRAWFAERGVLQAADIL